MSEHRALLAAGDAAHCVRLLRNPSMSVFQAVKVRLRESTAGWLGDFLGAGGLDVLLDCLEQLSGRGFTCFSDAVLQLDCLECARILLNSRAGVTYMLRDKALTRKLVLGLDTPNSAAKKQTVEVMTALCVFSVPGHQLITDALEHFQRITHQRHVTSVLLSELKLAENAPYKRALLALINALLRGHDDLHQRCRLRSQLITQDLLDILQYIRHHDNEPDVIIQLEVFYEEKQQDELAEEAAGAGGSQGGGVDVTSPASLLRALLTRSPVESSAGSHVLHILQDLLRLQDTQHQSSLLGLLSAVTHELVNLSTADHMDQAAEFVDELRAVLASRRPPHPTDDDDDEGRTTNNKPGSGAGSRLEQVRTELLAERDSGICVSGNDSFYDNVPPQTFTRRNSSPREALRPSPRTPGRPRCYSERADDTTPRRRPVPWTKLRPDQARMSLSVWRQIEQDVRWRRDVLDFSLLEREFSDDRARCTEPGQVQLLRDDQSLALNLFLARHDAHPECFADCLLAGDTDHIGDAGLQALLTLLPAHADVAALRGYAGDVSDLAPAERFLLRLTSTPHYRALLEALALRSRLSRRLPVIHEALQSVARAARDVLHHTGFRDFLALLLDAGNFLNAGSHVGRAPGVTLCSLRTVAEVRGHQGSLLGHVVRRAADKHPAMLDFITAFTGLKLATSHDFSSLQSEVQQIVADVTQLSLQPGSLDDLPELVQCVQTDVQLVAGLSSQLAQFFCEDLTLFDLQCCLKTVMELCELVRACADTGAVRGGGLQSAVVVSRRTQLLAQHHQAQCTLAFGHQADACSSFCPPQSEAVLDGLLQQVHTGVLEAAAPLMISHIDASPAPAVAVDALPSFVVNDLRSARKTYVDRVEEVIGRQYHREHQMTTASYITHQPDHCTKLVPPSGNKQGVHIKFYPKLSAGGLELGPPAAGGRRPGLHRRANSDLDRSTSADDNWLVYCAEQAAGGERRRGAGAESEDVLLAMGLEKARVALASEDEENWSELDQTLTSQGSNKQKKRPSIGFFKRFSSLRATLTQRNTKSGKEPKNRSKRGRPQPAPGKENTAPPAATVK